MRGPDTAPQRQDALVQAYKRRNGGPDGAGIATPYSGIDREPVRWLWPGRMPLGMLTLLVGDPGLGKSLLTCEVAAALSRTGGSTLLLTAEDSPSATVRPRLEAAGANLDLVHNATLRRYGVEEGLALPDDVDELDGLVVQTGARLVVVDPLMAHLPADVNSWRDQSVRTALAPLYRMATEHDCTVVVVLHLNKAKGGDPLHRVGGSIGIPGAVRSALLLARDPDDPEGERGNRRVLAHVKCNVAPLSASLSYEIEPVVLDDHEPVETARLRLLGESGHSGHDLLDAPQGDERTALDEAVEFLRAELSDGKRDARELLSGARGAGLSEKTLRRAKGELGVEVGRVGGIAGEGHWSWQLPKAVKPKVVNPISELGHLRQNPHSAAENGGPGTLRWPSGRDGPLSPATDGEESEAERIRSKWHDDDLSDLGPEQPLPDPANEARASEPCCCDHPVPWDSEDGRLCAKCGRAAS